MPSIHDVYQSNYLQIDPDFGEEDRIVLTIDRVKQETLTSRDGEQQQKLVVHFRETEKKFPLNKTNATTIASLYGDDYGDWAGKVIVLMTAPGNAFSNGKPVIRVLNRIVKAQPAAQRQQSVPRGATQPNRSRAWEDQEPPSDDEDIPF